MVLERSAPGVMLGQAVDYVCNVQQYYRLGSEIQQLEIAFYLTKSSFPLVDTTHNRWALHSVRQLKPLICEGDVGTAVITGKIPKGEHPIRLRSGTIPPHPSSLSLSSQPCRLSSSFLSALLDATATKRTLAARLLRQLLTCLLVWVTPNVSAGQRTLLVVCIPAACFSWKALSVSSSSPLGAFLGW